MIRWLRIAALGTVVVSLIGLGICVGLFLIANSGWVAVNVPPWLTGLFGDPRLEIWLPALIAGWLTAVILVAVGLAWSLYYVWRRRQYESLIARLERELARLRNLPFTEPAPLEDLPEVPDPAAARVLSALAASDGDGDDDGDGDGGGDSDGDSDGGASGDEPGAETNPAVETRPAAEPTRGRREEE